MHSRAPCTGGQAAQALGKHRELTRSDSSEAQSRHGWERRQAENVDRADRSRGPSPGQPRRHRLIPNRAVSEPRERHTCRPQVSSRPPPRRRRVDAVAPVAITCRSSTRGLCRRGGTEWRVRSVASCPSSMMTNRCGAGPQRGAGASPVTARGPHGGITDRVRRLRADPTGASTSS